MLICIVQRVVSKLCHWLIGWKNYYLIIFRKLGTNSNIWNVFFLELLFGTANWSHFKLLFISVLSAMNQIHSIFLRRDSYKGNKHYYYYFFTLFLCVFVSIRAFGKVRGVWESYLIITITAVRSLSHCLWSSQKNIVLSRMSIISEYHWNSNDWILLSRTSWWKYFINKSSLIPNW